MDDSTRVATNQAPPLAGANLYTSDRALVAAVERHASVETSRGLAEIGAQAGTEEGVLVQGDNTAISVLTSRYVLALQHQRQARLDTAATALRTACLTGVAQRRMAEPMTLSSGPGLTLAGGDLDEAVTGLLMNGIVASDANDDTVPAGFTRILAFRSGLHGDVDGCFGRFG